MFKQFYDLLILIRALLLLIDNEHRLTLEKYLITGMPDGNIQTAEMTGIVQRLRSHLSFLDLLSVCSDMVSTKDIAMACVDSLMEPASASSSKDQIIVYSTSDGIQNVVLNEEL